MNKQRSLLMQEHVEERAIGFAEWLDDNDYVRIREEKKWYNSKYPNGKPGKELYRDYIDFTLKLKRL